MHIYNCYVAIVLDISVSPSETCLKLLKLLGPAIHTVHTYEYNTAVFSIYIGRIKVYEYQVVASADDDIFGLKCLF
jgi:hypothetical protein